MATIIAVLMFLSLTLAISYYGYRHYARPGRVFEQVGGPALVMGSGKPVDQTEERGGLIIRTIRQIGEKVPVSPQDVSMTRRYLIAAGFRSDKAVYTLYGLKVLMCLAMLVGAYLMRGYLLNVPLFQFVVIISAGVAGYFGPGLILERMVAARQERIRYSLPDALDLMVVCVEAGLGLDQAIQNVSQELHLTHKDISEEFGLVTLEMRAGKRRSEALRNLADRTGESDLRKLVAVLIQTDRFGTSMAESLRTHSDFMRIERKQQAEERANKVGVKLVFPIFFCIMPAMFLVSGGPALIQIFKYLGPLMKMAAE